MTSLWSYCLADCERLPRGTAGAFSAPWLGFCGFVNRTMTLLLEMRNSYSTRDINLRITRSGAGEGQLASHVLNQSAEYVPPKERGL